MVLIKLTDKQKTNFYSIQIVASDMAESGEQEEVIELE